MPTNSFEPHGRFKGADEPTNQRCRGCGAVGHVTYRRWESHYGGYDDERYTCRACGYHWWVEGADA